MSANFAIGERELNERVRARFPVGSSEAAMAAELHRQGFSTDPIERDERGIWHSATVERHELVCIIIWSVRWRSQGQRITEIWAVYGSQCL